MLNVFIYWKYCTQLGVLKFYKSEPVRSFAAIVVRARLPDVVIHSVSAFVCTKEEEKKKEVKS